MDLKKLGFNSWFQERYPAQPDGFSVMRVSAVHKDNYTVTNGELEVLAETTGRLRFQAESALDLPAAGDWVAVQYTRGSSFVIIHTVLPRRSVLQRKTAGKKVDYQLIAANIDVAFLVQALDANFNLRRLERYLAMTFQSDIRAVVLLSKMDLLSSAQLAAKLAEIRERLPNLQVIAFSNLEQSALEEVRACLQPGETFCLLGSSGVGKTTLLNNLLGVERFETQEISDAVGKGKHTTTRRELSVLPNGSLLIDTPGMRELGAIGMDEGLDETFDEIVELARGCRFGDCSHTQEKGCAILEAVERGELAEERLRNYLKLKKESAFHEQSYLEKRRKGKELSKMYKSVQGQNRKRKSQ